MKALSKSEVADFLAHQLTDWTLQENTIHRDFKFKTFVEAFSFMTAIAFSAEKMNHHPDWSNSYNRVSVSLTTDEAKGITHLDFDLAAVMNQTWKNYQAKDLT